MPPSQILNESPFIEYELPRRLIAQEPLQNRADARLMVVDRQRQRIDHYHVRDLPQLLPAGDRLVLNDTKVIAAQLLGRREPTGGRWHGLYLGTTEQGHWELICKARGRLRPGEVIRLLDVEGRPGVKLWLIEPLDGGRWLAHPDAQESPPQLLERFGRVPLPPYIRDGNMVDADVVNYQTVFARVPGAVAAPTAGLHFTKELLQTLVARGIPCSAITLHVGLGTFRPISSTSLDQHAMHAEWGQMTSTAADALNATREQGGRVVAVGTTVVRVLESAMQSATAGRFEPWSGETSLFIRPPFEFRGVDALLTNFHFPRTTLLLLVEAFGGRRLVERAYHEAIREEYRFYSYGDAMLLV